MGHPVLVQQLPLRRVPGPDDHPFGKSYEIRGKPARLYRVPPNRNAPVESKDTGTHGHRFQCSDEDDDGERYESDTGKEI